MLSGKYIIVLLLLSIALAGCYKKEGEQNPQTVNDVNNPEYLKTKLKERLNQDIKFLLRGKFASDSLSDIAAGTEVMNKKEWGIKFYLFRASGDSLQKVYETKLLDGSFKESKVEKLTLPDTDHDFIYYNSMNYFMGSAGGEILAYIIDLKAEKVYYAHLVSEPDGKVNLFLSDNENTPVDNFFRNLFRKDFPNLKMSSKDPVLD